MMAREAAHMATAKAWHQHRVVDFAADGAGELSGERLPGFAVRAPIQCSLSPTRTFRRSVRDYRRSKDRHLLRMATIGAVTLEIKTVKTGQRVVVGCNFWEGRCCFGAAIAPVLAGVYIDICIAHHSSDLHNFALLDMESPYG